MPKTKKEIQTWLTIFDLHYPLHDMPTFNAAMEFMASNNIDGFIFGGDQFSNDNISHHTEGKPIYRERASYQQETDGFNKNILSPLDKVLGDAKKIWIVGNHDRF